MCSSDLTELLELLLKEHEPDAPPLLSAAQAPQQVIIRPMPAPLGPDRLPLLDFISKSSRELIESGGTPGSWNDDQLRLALDLRGTEDWIREQGHNPDLTASQAFALHIQAASLKSKDFNEAKAWRQIGRAHV